MSIDRRTFIRGAAASGAIAAGGWPWAAMAAEPAPLLFADTPLAANPAARLFRRVDMALPDIPVQTATGRASLAGVGGKTRLISLWAEWCVPCLIEIRDFAAVRARVATDRFDIGLLMTASVAKLDYPQAVARLRPMGGAGLPLLVEPDGGHRAADTLAMGGAPRPAGLPGAVAAPPVAGGRPGRGPGFSLPCTLLVDAKGRVKGRSFGAPAVGRPGGASQLTEEQKAALKRGESVVVRSQPLSDADKGKLMADGKTLWASPMAEAFLKALGDGLLDRV